MFLEFETINFTSPACINGWQTKRIIQHHLIQDFEENEDGSLLIFLYEGTDSFTTNSFTKTELIEKLKEIEIKE